MLIELIRGEREREREGGGRERGVWVGLVKKLKNRKGSWRFYSLDEKIAD